MTEEDAKKKWCPYMQVSYADKGAVSNRAGTTFDNFKCIAAGCMAWIPERRWKEGDHNVVDGGRCGLVNK